MITSKDQEDIFNLYCENFRDIELTQNTMQKYRPVEDQNPNNSTAIWQGIMNPTSSKRVLTPRSENNEESSFVYILKKSPEEKYTFIKSNGNTIYLKSSSGSEVSVPIEKFKNLFQRLP